MKVITIRHEQAGYVATNARGKIVARDLRLAGMRADLVTAIGGGAGKITYLRPSWPGGTSPVTLLDCRPKMNYRGGSWAG